MDPVDSEYAGRDTRGAVAWAGVVFDDGTDNAALATGTVEAELWPRCISIAVRLTTTSAARPRTEITAARIGLPSHRCELLLFRRFAEEGEQAVTGDVKLLWASAGAVQATAQ